MEVSYVGSVSSLTFYGQHSDVLDSRQGTKRFRNGVGDVAGELHVSPSTEALQFIVTSL